TLPGTAAVVNAVTKDPGSIGYGGIAYGGSVKQVGIAGADGNAVVASEATIRDGTYALSRPLFWYLTAKTPESGRAMLAWVTSAEGQATVKEVGYFPVN
ncbi:MAG: phosphate ABC transporter substrate-binding protein, partial [Candidatus Eisenbacteria bacterium]